MNKSGIKHIKEIIAYQELFENKISLDTLEQLINHGAQLKEIKRIILMQNRYKKPLSDGELNVLCQKGADIEEIMQIIWMQNRFDGKLTEEVLEKLKSAGATGEDIKEIRYYLRKENHSEGLTTEQIDDILSACTSITEKKEFFYEIMDYIHRQNRFDGKMTQDEYDRLVAGGLSVKEIEKIKTYLEKYKNNLTCFRDLVGDRQIPGKLFFHNMDKYGDLLCDEPEKTYSRYEKGFKLGWKISNMLLPAIHKLGQNFMGSNHIIEDRNKLLAYSKRKRELERHLIEQLESGQLEEIPLDALTIDLNTLEYEPDPGIKVPEEPTIWAMNHAFKDDAISSIKCISRPFTLLFGSLPQFYNTFDGVLAYNIGTTIVNRNSLTSRNASQHKLEYALNMGLDVLMAPEGVLNKNVHKLVEEVWPGMYRAAKATGSKIIPIIHYIFDPTQKIHRDLNPIHTIIDDPIDVSNMSESEALQLYTNRVAKWYYIMMEMYGQTTRKALLKNHTDMESLYNDAIKGLLDTVAYYDSLSEKRLTRENNDIATPEEVWEAIVALHPDDPNNEIHKLVISRKKSNLQHRF